MENNSPSFSALLIFLEVLMPNLDCMRYTWIPPAGVLSADSSEKGKMEHTKEHTSATVTMLHEDICEESVSFRGKRQSAEQGKRQSAEQRKLDSSCPVLARGCGA